jgi:prepilin-type N-terminal cleavage/methylation domain-containing protein
MERKYTIFKVLTRNSSKGFTLIELLIGITIMALVGGLAMQAFLQASNSFGKDKKNIDSNQSLSAVLEMIGNDIRQAGEQINDASFPAIEFSPNPAGFSGSSRITVRRAVSLPLTLCQAIPANTMPTGTLLVASSGVPNLSCNIGLQNSPLAVARPGTSYYYNTATAPSTTTPAAIPSPALAPLLPIALRQARDYRCQLSDLNPAIPYADPSQATNDFCGGTPAQVARQFSRIAVSDQQGHVLIFRHTGENISTMNATTPPTQASINIDTSFANASDPAVASNTQNIGVTTGYPIGSPIYLIEERVYELLPDPSNSTSGILTLSINGNAPERLVKGIADFDVSARLYTDALNQAINPTPAPPVVTAPATTISATAFVCPVGGTNNQPTPAAATTTDPRYVCQFNYNALVSDVPMNWKTIAGIRVSLQAKYDATGQSATASAADLAKLRAQAEFFPRNVLSK